MENKVRKKFDKSDFKFTLKRVLSTFDNVADDDARFYQINIEIYCDSSGMHCSVTNISE